MFHVLSSTHHPGVAIPRHQHKGNDLRATLHRDGNASEFYAQAMAKYESLCKSFLRSHECPEDQIEFEMKKIMDMMELSSLLVRPRENVGIHRDPPSPAPAGIFGRGNYDGHDSQGGELGGNLVIVDSMLHIDREHCDFVLMDGNLCHGVSNLRQTHGEEVTRSRFSMILFSRYKRKRMKAPGNYKIDFSFLR